MSEACRFLSPLGHAGFGSLTFLEWEILIELGPELGTKNIQPSEPDSFRSLTLGHEL